MPAVVDPMAAQLAAGIPAAEERYGFEFKWDGIRAITFWDGRSLRLQTRNRNDVTPRYPEMAPLAQALGAHQVERPPGPGQLAAPRRPRHLGHGPIDPDSVGTWRPSWCTKARLCLPRSSPVRRLRWPHVRAHDALRRLLPLPIDGRGDRLWAGCP
jgi:hypothetical protein